MNADPWIRPDGSGLRRVDLFMTTETDGVNDHDEVMTGGASPYEGLWARLSSSSFGSWAETKARVQRAD
jgi:hypothetical protein